MANIEQKIDHDSLLESGYKPLRVLAEKYGYAKDHIGWLARTGRIEAVRYGNRGEWYALEESIADHKKEKVGRFESVSSIDKSSSQPKSSEVLFSVPSNKSSYSAKPTLTEVSEELRRSNPSNFSQEKLGRVNAIPRFLLILAGGILVLINFVPAIDFNKTPLAKYYSKFEDSFIEPTKNKSASLIDNVSNNISADILSPIRNFVAKYLLPEYTYETYLVVDLETRDKRQATRDRELESRIRELENLVSSTRSSSDGPSRIIKQVTTPNGYILTQLEQRVDNISSLMETTRVNLSNLSSDFSSFQRITPTTLILPPTNTKGIGPITLNPDKLSSNTLTVSGSSTLNSLTVDTTLSVTNDLTVDTNVFRVDTSNNRVGINTASPAVSLDVVGSASFTQQLKLTKAPTAAHSGTWPSFTNTSDSSLYINPSSPTADSNIIAYVNNTSPKFLVDAEGDIYGASLILTGTTTTGTTTTQGDLTVEGNTTLGDSSTDKVKFRGTILPYSLSSIPFSVKASQSQTVDIFRVLDPSDKILLTIDQGYGLLYASGGFNFGGGAAASVSYSRLGSGTTTHSGTINSFDDLLVSGGFEVNGSAAFDGILSINNVSYTFPSADGSSNQFLRTNGSGTLTWATAGVSSNSLDFDEFVNTMLLDANLTINRGGFFLGLGQTPSTVFEVQGTASASYLLTGNTLQVGGYASTAYSRFGTNTTGHSNYITTSNDLLVSGDLEVDGSISAQFASSSQMFITNTTASASLSFRGNGSGGANQSAFSIGVGNGTERLNIFNNDRSPIVTIASSGNVGIGQTAPVDKLHISSASQAKLRFTFDTTGHTATDGFAINAESTTADFILYETGNMRFATSDAVKMTIFDNGNVTIAGNCSDAAGGGGCTADYAEVYHRDVNDLMEATDLLALNPANGKVTKASAAYPNIIGIFSSSPGSLIGQRANSIQLGVGKGVMDDLDPDEIPVALVGRVVVKVSEENGPIMTGDRLTISATLPGYAMRMTEPGQSIGIALEASSGTDGKILTFVNLGYWVPSIDSLASLGVDDSTVNGNLIFAAVTGMFKEAFNVVFENGIIKVARGIFEEIETKFIKSDYAEINKGITIYDEITNQPYCLKIQNGTTLTLSGKCSDQNPSPTPTPSTAPESTPMPEATPEPEPTQNPEQSPESAPESISESTPELSPEPILETTPTPEPI